MFALCCAGNFCESNSCFVPPTLPSQAPPVGQETKYTPHQAFGPGPLELPFFLLTVEWGSLQVRGALALFL